MRSAGPQNTLGRRVVIERYRHAEWGSPPAARLYDRPKDPKKYVNLVNLNSAVDGIQMPLKARIHWPPQLLRTSPIRCGPDPRRTRLNHWAADRMAGSNCRIWVKDPKVKPVIAGLQTLLADGRRAPAPRRRHKPYQPAQ